MKNDRRGAQVAQELFPKNLIRLDQSVLPIGNTVLGGDCPRVVFGTSGLWNAYEVLVAIKVAAGLGLPLVWFNYPSAYVVEEQLELTTYQSLPLLDPDPIGSDEIGRQVEGSLAVQAEFGHWFATANGCRVEITTSSLEDLIQRMGIMEMLVIDYVAALLECREGIYRAFNLLDGGRFRGLNTNSRLGAFQDWTIRDLHDRGGWLSGAGIHWTLRHLADYGPYVEVLPDLSRGNVYEMYAGVGSNFRGILTGRFHLRAEGQTPEWASICPLVFLELIRRWGPEKAERVARTLWEAIAVSPQAPVGLSFVVTKDGAYRV